MNLDQERILRTTLDSYFYQLVQAADNRLELEEALRAIIAQQKSNAQLSEIVRGKVLLMQGLNNDEKLWIKLQKMSSSPDSQLGARMHQQLIRELVAACSDNKMAAISIQALSDQKLVAKHKQDFIEQGVWARFDYLQERKRLYPEIYAEAAKIIVFDRSLKAQENCEELDDIIDLKPEHPDDDNSRLSFNEFQQYIASYFCQKFAMFEFAEEREAIIAELFQDQDRLKLICEYKLWEFVHDFLESKAYNAINWLIGAMTYRPEFRRLIQANHISYLNILDMAECFNEEQFTILFHMIVFGNYYDLVVSSGGEFCQIIIDLQQGHDPEAVVAFLRLIHGSSCIAALAASDMLILQYWFEIYLKAETENGSFADFVKTINTVNILSDGRKDVLNYAKLNEFCQQNGFSELLTLLQAVASDAIGGLFAEKLLPDNLFDLIYADDDKSKIFAMMQLLTDPGFKRFVRQKDGPLLVYSNTRQDIKQEAIDCLTEFAGDVGSINCKI